MLKFPKNFGELLQIVGFKLKIDECESDWQDATYAIWGDIP